MRFQLEQRQQGIFIAESEKVTRRLLASNLPVLSLILPDTMLEELHEMTTRIERLSRAEHDLISDVHAQVSEIKEQVENVTEVVSSENS